MIMEKRQKEIQQITLRKKPFLNATQRRTGHSKHYWFSI